MAPSFRNLVQVCKKSCERFHHSRLFGEKQADGTWTWITFGDFALLVDDFRGGLASLGVGVNDRVAIVSNNRVEWAVAAYATYGLGAAFVPMYEAQQPAEWKFILDDCGAKAVLGSAKAVAPKLKPIAETSSSLEHVIALDDPDAEHGYEKLLAIGREKPVPEQDPDPESTAGFLYTSGTTGEPKGVMLSHKNFCSNIEAVAGLFDHGQGDRALSFLHWAHALGQTADLHSMMSKGCAIAINDDVANLVTNLPVVKPTLLVAVPRIFNRIYDGVNRQISERPAPIRALFRSGITNANKKRNGQQLGLAGELSLLLADKLIFEKIRQRFGGRLRFTISGSAALSPEVAEFIDALGIEVYEGYGLTETSPVATVNYPGHRKIGSVGKPLPGVTIRIDESLSDDPGQGEIIICGPNVMQGYHNRPEENARVLLPDGCFRSGDLGRLDKDGYLYVTGRIKEQYKLETGKYVVPSPLEEQLKLSPYIANIMIYGVDRPHNVALVVPDQTGVQRWAQSRGHALGPIEQDPELKRLLLSEIERLSGGFKSYERPRDIAVIAEDFTLENGMLTPSLKVKRRNVLKAYQSVVDGLY